MLLWVVHSHLFFGVVLPSPVGWCCLVVASVGWWCFHLLGPLSGAAGHYPLFGWCCLLLPLCGGAAVIPMKFE